jgi:hypothetical protein
MIDRLAVTTARRVRASGPTVAALARLAGHANIRRVLPLSPRGARASR